MKAAVYRGGGQPLVITDVPKPEPKAGEVLVRVAGCGLCHTDLHYLDHGVPTFKAPPIILGHEAAGTVATLGPAADGWQIGDRVLAPSVNVWWTSCGVFIH